MSKDLEELTELLGIKQKLGPGTHQQEFIDLKCYCDFEPFGRATED